MATEKGSILLAHIGRLVAAAMLFWALDDHPYGYFTLLRIVVCAVSAFCAYMADTYDRSAWIWFFVVIAILFNPIWPIHLERETWQFIDVGVGIVMLISIFSLKPERLDKILKGKGAS